MSTTNKLTIFSFSLVIALVLPVTAQATENAMYVGGGRYVGEGKSVEDAQLRQRSDEYSERERDMQDNERRYERSERRERDYDYRDRSDEY
ncbi:MAG: hypothetical protein ABIR00_07700 [Nitrosospira sp.]